MLRKKASSWGLQTICQLLGIYCHENGAELCFTYPNEAMKDRVIKLGAELGSTNFIECDVSKQSSIESACNQIKSLYSELDFIVHAVAFFLIKMSSKGRYIDTSYEKFQNTMNISCYSLTAIANTYLLLCQTAVAVVF